MTELMVETPLADVAVGEAQGTQAPLGETGLAKDDGTSKMITRIGQLTRTLRDSMRELGLDKQVERAAETIPDARDRLRYVASMTEQAAERALNAIDVAQPLQDALGKQAQSLDLRWQQWYDAPLDDAGVRALVADTRGYLQEVPARTQATGAQLMEIMMAQDFQDLTGQVIKKITGIVQTIEQQLLGVLLENLSEEKRTELAAAMSGAGMIPAGDNSLLNGPVINPESRTDIVADQSQVDDLLASMGF